MGFSLVAASGGYSLVAPCGFLTEVAWTSIVVAKDSVVAASRL